MDVTVADMPEQRRYEARTDSERIAGVAEYTRTGGLVVFTHTEVDPDFEGRGVGGTLVRGALDDVRSRGLAVHPLCPFVREWIQRHPDYGDLVHPAAESGAAD